MLGFSPIGALAIGQLPKWLAAIITTTNTAKVMYVMREDRAMSATLKSADTDRSIAVKSELRAMVVGPRKRAC